MHKQDMSSYIQRKYSPWLRSYARTVVRNIVHDYIKASRTICFLTCCTNYQYPRRIRCMHALLIKPSMSALNHNVLTAERSALNPKRDFYCQNPSITNPCPTCLGSALSPRSGHLSQSSRLPALARVMGFVSVQRPSRRFCIRIQFSCVPALRHWTEKKWLSGVGRASRCLPVTGRYATLRRGVAFLGWRWGDGASGGWGPNDAMMGLWLGVR
jgi:hypothetical protein